MIQWVSVPGFVGYELSSEGVLNLRGQGDIRPTTYANGDLRFRIEQYSTLYYGPCWRLMATSWYLGYRLGMEPVFLDGDRTNHSLDNLEFVEVSARSGDYETVRWRQEGKYRRFDRRLGRQIRDDRTGLVYNSLDEVAAAIGGQKQNVSAVLHGRLKQHCGRTFSYV